MGCQEQVPLFLDTGSAWHCPLRPVLGGPSAAQAVLLSPGPMVLCLGAQLQTPAPSKGEGGT